LFVNLACDQMVVSSDPRQRKGRRGRVQELRSRGCARRSTNGSRLSSIVRRRDLGEGPPQPSHRIRRGDRRCRRQHRRAVAKCSAWTSFPLRPRRSNRVSAQAAPARPCVTRSYRLRRPRGRQGRRRQADERRLAGLSRPPWAMRPTPAKAAGASLRFHRPASAQDSARSAKTQWRKVADQLAQVAQARRLHERGRDRGARLCELRRALAEAERDEEFRKAPKRNIFSKIGIRVSLPIRRIASRDRAAGVTEKILLDAAASPNRMKRGPA
jgi:hypothetical protein